MRVSSKHDSTLFTEPKGCGEGDVMAAVGASVSSVNLPPMPPIPTVLLTRKDLSRLFEKNVQEPDRWERKGWIHAYRRRSGRVAGYGTLDVVRIAVRLFTRFRHGGFNDAEAVCLGLKPLLDWVRDGIRQQLAVQQHQAAPVFDLVSLAGLAGEIAILPKEWGVTEDQFKDQAQAARHQLLRRLEHPPARQAMIRGWREAGVLVATERTPKPPVAAEPSNSDRLPAKRLLRAEMAL